MSMRIEVPRGTFGPEIQRDELGNLIEPTGHDDRWPGDEDAAERYETTRSVEQTGGPRDADDEPQTLDSRLIDGAQFVLDTPAEVPAVWGKDQEVLWAAGEAMIIAGPQGVGKTTIAQQLILARLGLRTEVVGWPVEPGHRRVLYLAMDRPRQAARSLHRMVSEDNRRILSDRLAVWRGPPPFDLARYTSVLTSMCQSAGADTVVVDSLKDAFIGLSNDEAAAGYNRARQTAIAAGIEVVEITHPVKRGVNNTKPDSLADVYGSVWITSGAGSVLVLSGAAGDPIVDLHHRKQPAEEVGPLRILHDHERGLSTVWHAVDLLQMARAAPGGITARAAAGALSGTDKPEPGQVEKARRRLDSLTLSGQLHRIDGDRARQTPAVYFSADRLPLGGAA
jgi:AAA domain